MLNSYHDISSENLDKIIYKSGTMKTPFLKNTEITYADFIASGLPSPFVEKYIQEKIYPYYANTHSNAHNGIFMKNMINETKTYIRKEMNLSDDYQIIFSGNGATGASNHLMNSIDCSKYDRVIIFISLYEHYSNHLPWVELSKTCSKIELKIIPFISNTNYSGIIDLKWLVNSIANLYVTAGERNKTLVICSISACSNINGIMMPLQKIRKILDNFDDNGYFHKYFFSDFACCAPYIKIDGSIFDAFFFSPHKFIGGMSTPGVLIAKKCLFSKPKPFCSGGGCVVQASSKKVIYDPDIEKRESAGTPNIVGIIKIGKILQLKKHFQNIIDNNEHLLSKLIKEKIKYFEKKYQNFRAVLYNDEKYHLPILSFHLTNMHFNLIVVLLNDLFGIQTRGGIGCCGLLSEFIENTYKFRGWCRVSFHWLMNSKTIDDIFKAIEFIIENGHKYEKYYEYDHEHHIYYYKGK